MSSILGTYARKAISFKKGKGSYLFAENGGSFMVYAKENQFFDPILINEIISKPWAGPMILGNSNINYNGPNYINRR